MNDAHHGPHCAGSCEGAAYNIEIQRLRADNEALREAARTGAAWMQWWIDQADCECDGVHVCGKRERVSELQTIHQALAAHDRGEK